MRRRTRWFVRALIWAPLIAVAGVLALMRSPAVEWAAARVLEPALGCRLRAQRAVLGFDGRVEMDGLRLQVPGVDGTPGEFLAARSLTIDLDWSGFPFAMPRPVAVRLVEPVFRVSISRDDGAINLDALDPVKGTGSRIELPRIDTVRGLIEFGEHWPGGYVPLTQMPVEGLFTPTLGSATHYTMRMRQTGAAAIGVGPLASALPQPTAPAAGMGAVALPMLAAGEAGEGAGPASLMLLEGRLDLEKPSAELRLYDVALADWPPDAVPSAVRELWRMLNIRGNVTPVTFTYTPEIGVSVQIALDNVSMDALVPADSPELAGDDTLSLADVRGVVRLSRKGLRAELDGTIEDLPCRIVLRTDGLDLDAALRCEITTERFVVGENPRLLPFAPPVVRERFATFSGPTAVVDALVRIERAAPANGQASPFRVAGSLAFQHGAAAFDKFPYPVSDLQGLVAFTDERVEILGIRGRGPTGAAVLAQGVIAPPTKQAQADIEVIVLNVPVDDILAGALPESRRAVLDTLFDRERERELLEAGLIVPPEERRRTEEALAAARVERLIAERAEPPDPERLAAVDARIAAIQTRLKVPAFAVGGTADLAIQVRRAPGQTDNWSYEAEVRFAEAGVLPSEFPYPIRARGVTLVLSATDATIGGGTYQGLRGGEAEFEASISLEENGRAIFRPQIRVAAEGVPVDDLLINAIPGGEEGGGPEGDALSPKGLLRSMQIAGEVSCRAEIFGAHGSEGETATATAFTETSEDADAAPPANARLNYDVRVTLDRLRAEIAPGAPADRNGETPDEGLALADVSGEIHITQDELTIRGMAAQLRRTGRADAPLDGTDGSLSETAAGDLRIDLRAALGDGDRREQETPDRPALAASIAARALDIGARLERFVALVSESKGEVLVRLREDYAPRGFADGVLTVEQVRREAPALALDVSAARGLRFEIGGTELSLAQTAGRVRAESGPIPVVDFRAAAVRVGVEGESAGELTLDGRLPLMAFAEPGAAQAPSPEILSAALRANAVGLATESPLVRRAIERFAPSRLRDAYARFEPAGTFDAEVLVTPDAEDHADESPYNLAGRVAPKRLSFLRGATRVVFPSVRGEIRFTEEGGRISGLRADAEGWGFAAEGDWVVHADRAITFDADLSLEADRFRPEIAALLPANTAATLAAAGFTTTGPIRFRDTRLSVQTGDTTDFRLDGVAEFVGAEFDLGIPATDTDGELTVRVRGSGDDPADFRLDLSAPRLRLSGLLITDARGHAVSGTAPGDLIVPEFSGNAYGGRVSGSAAVHSVQSPSAAALPRDDADGLVLTADARSLSVLPARPSIGWQPGYQVHAVIAGARFGPVLRALSVPGAGGESGEDLLDESRGRLDASFSLASYPVPHGAAPIRRGRGAIRVAGGDVVQLPLILPLLELSNLQIPSADPLDYLQATFDLRDDAIRFDQIALMSESISVLGAGSVGWPGLELDLKFNSQTSSTKRVPIWTDLFEALRNELISTEISGTLVKPEFNTVTLRTTRRMLSGLFGPREGEVRTTPQTERTARSERDRHRTGLEGRPVAQPGGAHPRGQRGPDPDLP